MSWNEDLRAALAERRDRGLHRTLRKLRGKQGAEILIDGHAAANFASNNYLGLASSDVLVAAAREAVQRYGTGAGASRLIGGNLEIHEQLEDQLAAWMGTERALLFNSGYQANVGVLSALVGPGDLVLSDQLNHASIIDGCRLSRATVKIYRHLDVAHAQELLAAHAASHRRTLIVTDSVFSMDGHRAPLAGLAAAAQSHDAWLMVDEAHAVGVLGDNGAGLAAETTPTPIQVRVGTLGKALGSSGAYVCGSAMLIEYLQNHSRAFIYSTAPGLPACAAAVAALRIVRAPEGQALRHRLRQRIHDLCDALHQQEILVHREHILPLYVKQGDDRLAMKISQMLLRAGIFAQGIRPPTVPAGTARIRLSLMASHEDEHAERLISAIKMVRSDLASLPPTGAG